MLNTNTQTIVNLLSSEELSVKEAVKIVTTEHKLNVDYRTVYRVFRTHGTLTTKGKFVKRAEEEKIVSSNQSSEPILAAETNSKAA